MSPQGAGRGGVLLGCTALCLTPGNLQAGLWDPTHTHSSSLKDKGPLYCWGWLCRRAAQLTLSVAEDGSEKPHSERGLDFGGRVCFKEKQRCLQDAASPAVTVARLSPLRGAACEFTGFSEGWDQAYRSFLVFARIL